MSPKPLSEYLEETRRVLATLAASGIDARIEPAIDLITSALRNRLPLLICGNGGSASDSMHIAGELVGRFLKERPAYKVISLSSNPAVLTAWANDYEYQTIFSRQVEAYGEKGGVLMGISTSGNSANVVEALKFARQIGMGTIALTGQGGGACAPHTDILLDVPSTSTPRIQEAHIGIYHYLCGRIEQALTD
jgi:D-sedoheptulose 7-phosphate isomerase